MKKDGAKAKKERNPIRLQREGDIFYIVVDKKRPKKPIITYNSKFYDLEDIEPE